MSMDYEPGWYDIPPSELKTTLFFEHRCKRCGKKQSTTWKYDAYEEARTALGILKDAIYVVALPCPHCLVDTIHELLTYPYLNSKLFPSLPNADQQPITPTAGQ